MKYQNNLFNTNISNHRRFVPKRVLLDSEVSLMVLNYSLEEIIDSCINLLISEDTTAIEIEAINKKIEHSILIDKQDFYSRVEQAKIFPQLFLGLDNTRNQLPNSVKKMNFEFDCLSSDNTNMRDIQDTSLNLCSRLLFGVNDCNCPQCEIEDLFSDEFRSIDSNVNHPQLDDIHSNHMVLHNNYDVDLIKNSEEEILEFTDSNEEDIEWEFDQDLPPIQSHDILESVKTDSDQKQESEKEISPNKVLTVGATDQDFIQNLLEYENLGFLNQYVQKPTFFGKIKSTLSSKWSKKNWYKKVLTMATVSLSIGALSTIITPAILTFFTGQASTLASVLVAKSCAATLGFNVLKEKKFREFVDLNDTAKLQDQIVKAIENNELNQVYELIEQLKEISKEFYNDNQLASNHLLANSAALKTTAFMTTASFGLMGTGMIASNIASNFDSFSDFTSKTSEFISSNFSKLQTGFNNYFSSQPITTQHYEVPQITTNKTSLFGSSHIDLSSANNTNLEVKPPSATIIEFQVKESLPQLPEPPKLIHDESLSADSINQPPAAEVIDQPISTTKVNFKLTDIPTESTIDVVKGKSVTVNIESGRLNARSDNLSKVVKKISKGTKLILTGETKLAENSGTISEYVQVKTRWGKKLWVARNYLK